MPRGKGKKKKGWFQKVGARRAIAVARYLGLPPTPGFDALCEEILRRRGRAPANGVLSKDEKRRIISEFADEVLGVTSDAEQVQRAVRSFNSDAGPPGLREQKPRRVRSQRQPRLRDLRRVPERATPKQSAWVNSRAFLDSFEWRRLRMEILKKYGARCMCCGATPSDGVKVNVDHIKPRRDFPELALDASNLQVLCEACNHGKSNWDQTDWRPAS